MRNIQDEIIDIERELRDLKTAQPIPGVIQLYTASGIVPAQTYAGAYTWTIHYEDVGDTDAPITQLGGIDNSTLLAYDPATNTQKVEYAPTSATIYQQTSFQIRTSRPVTSITRDF